MQSLQVHNKLTYHFVSSASLSRTGITIEGLISDLKLEEGRVKVNFYNFENTDALFKAPRPQPLLTPWSLQRLSS